MEHLLELISRNNIVFLVLITIVDLYYYNGGFAEGVSVWGAVIVEELFVVGVVVWFFTDSGIPHIFDSVELTKLSLGLLGLHI